MPDLLDQGPAAGSDQTTGQFSKADMLARAQHYLDLAKASTDPAVRAENARLAISALPGDSLLDPETGQLRDKTWWERNAREGLNIEGLLTAASLAIGGYYSSGSNALISAAPGASDAGTLASLGTGASELTAGGAPAVAAAVGSGTLAGLSTRGGPSDPSPDSSLADPNTASSYTDPSAETLEGTSGASTPLTPAQPADSYIADPGMGANGTPNAFTSPTGTGVPPASIARPVATQGGSSLIPGVDNKSLLGGIISSALTFAQSKANADAAKTASEQEIAAANKALDLQNQQFNLSRGDYLQRQAYTQQQIGGLAPYQDIGTGALSNLRSLTGLPARPGLASTPPAASLPPPVVPSGSLSSLSTQPTDNRRPPTAGVPTGQTAVPKMITVRDTQTGEVQQRPYAELQHWQSVPGAQVTA